MLGSLEIMAALEAPPGAQQQGGGEAGGRRRLNVANLKSMVRGAESGRRPQASTGDLAAFPNETYAPDEGVWNRDALDDFLETAYVRLEIYKCPCMAVDGTCTGDAATDRLRRVRPAHPDLGRRSQQPGRRRQLHCRGLCRRQGRHARGGADRAPHLPRRGGVYRTGINALAVGGYKLVFTAWPFDGAYMTYIGNVSSSVAASAVQPATAQLVQLNRQEETVYKSGFIESRSVTPKSVIMEDSASNVISLSAQVNDADTHTYQWTVEGLTLTGTSPNGWCGLEGTDAKCGRSGNGLSVGMGGTDSKKLIVGQTQGKAWPGNYATTLTCAENANDNPCATTDPALDADDKVTCCAAVGGYDSSSPETRNAIVSVGALFKVDSNMECANGQQTCLVRFVLTMTDPGARGGTTVRGEMVRFSPADRHTGLANRSSQSSIDWRASVLAPATLRGWQRFHGARRLAGRRAGLHRVPRCKRRV